MLATNRLTARMIALVGLLAVLLAAMASAPARPAHADEPDRGKLLLVLDSSGSMKEPDASGSTKIAAAKQALNTVVDKLPEDAPVGLRVYGATVFEKSDQGACSDSQLVVPIGPADKPALKQAIGGYKPYGETPIAYSLKQAAKDVGTEGQRTILLVSDGEETCDPDPCAVAKVIHDQGIDLKIDVVGLHVDAAAKEHLTCIAKAGGGKYYDADDAADLTATLDQSALRAFRPFTLSGTPVQGATTESAAALEVEPGQYTDELGGTAEETGRRYYTIRPAPGASVHVGFTAYPPSRGGLMGYKDAAKLALKAPDGTECVGNIGLQMVAGTRPILVGSISFVPQQVEEGSPCASAEQLVLEIQRGTGSSIGNPAPESGTIPFEFLVIQEPRLADDSGLPEPLAMDTTPSQDVAVAPGAQRGKTAGGGGFSQAATLEPGTWTDSIQPGEVLFYRVRVDWGQTPAVSFKVHPSARAEQVLGAGGVNTNVDAFAPTRAHVQNADLHSVLATQTTTLTSALMPVRYRNREGDLSDSSARRMVALAGYYYFVITMDTAEAKFELPMDISVEVSGEPTGRPEYEDVPRTEPEPTAGPEDGDDGSGAKDGSGTTDGSGDGGQAAPSEVSGIPIMPVALAGGAGLLVIAGIVLIAVPLGRRNRRRGVPPPPPQAGPW
jgi:Ca-activated chloride channel homolog